MSARLLLVLIGVTATLAAIQPSHAQSRAVRCKSACRGYVKGCVLAQSNHCVNAGSPDALMACVDAVKRECQDRVHDDCVARTPKKACPSVKARACIQGCKTLEDDCRSRECTDPDSLLVDLACGERCTRATKQHCKSGVRCVGETVAIASKVDIASATCTNQACTCGTILPQPGAIHTVAAQGTVSGPVGATLTVAVGVVSAAAKMLECPGWTPIPCATGLPLCCRRTHSGQPPEVQWQIQPISYPDRCDCFFDGIGRFQAFITGPTRTSGPDPSFWPPLDTRDQIAKCPCVGTCD